MKVVNSLLIGSHKPFIGLARRFSHGKLAEHRDGSDQMSLMQQLSVDASRG